MSRFPPAGLYLCALLFVALPGGAEEVIRFRVSSELEAAPPAYMEEPVVMDRARAERNAREESVLVIGGMIYGWNFEHEIGEKARGIAERFFLSDRGGVDLDDPRLSVTDTEVEDSHLRLWVEYAPDEAQARRLAAWKSGDVKRLQGLGSAPHSNDMKGKRAALEDAARAAVRAYLRGTDRNRPKGVRGSVALAAAPRYYVEAGRWTVSARFLLVVDELIPFSVY